MDWKVKSGIIAAILLVIATLGFIIKYQRDTINRLQTIEKSVIEAKDLGNGLQRAQANYATKGDLEVLIKDRGINISDLQKDLDKLGADVRAINVVKVITPGYNVNNLPTDHQIPNPNPIDNDKWGYLKAEQRKELTEPLGSGMTAPLGEVGFSAWQQKPWAITLYPREYSTTTVLAVDENGRHFSYNKFQIKVNGKEYTAPIQSKFVEEYPESKFRFSPRIYLSIDGGAIANNFYWEAMPNFTLSLFSYGQTKVNSDWIFANIGLGYATQGNNIALILSPVNYNIGKNLPLVDNLYVGPAFSLDLNGNFGIYGGLRVGL
jgi:hypothetical protein